MAHAGLQVLAATCWAFAFKIAGTEALTNASLNEVTVADWARGSETWKTVHAEDGLWTQPNYCEPSVIHSSAPLSVLFGISTFWEEIKHRRASLAQTATEVSEKPLEVHILGAAYPFEGRSDWSLLAARRPPDVPKVRVVLVLGTPWHQDNVPVMKAEEFDEKRSFLMQFKAQTRNASAVVKPETGKLKDGGIECRRRGALTQEDKEFKTSDLCKDHGNGLEVVCVEKYYQEVSDELPKPDVVAMFSPGFPQIARRSWDQVLRSLVVTEVPIMVVDLLYSSSVPKVFAGKNKEPVAPGNRWKVKKSRFEDGMTLTAMSAYGARRLGAYRNPFPILIERGRDDITAKNAVIQVFRGRLNSAKPLKMPSEKAVARRQKIIKALDLRHAMEDEDSAKEIKTSLLIPTTKAYDKAMWQTYRGEIKKWVQNKIRRKENKPADKEWMAMVEKMGLTGKKRRKPWNLKEWIFVLSKLKVGDEFF